MYLIGIDAKIEATNPAMPITRVPSLTEIGKEPSVTVFSLRSKVLEKMQTGPIAETWFVMPRTKQTQVARAYSGLVRASLAEICLDLLSEV